MSKNFIISSPDSTPHNLKTTISEWENTPSPLRSIEQTNAECKNLNTHEYEKDESPLLESIFCNPEPPLELLEHHLVNADNIGNSVFSKHWLLTTLIKLIKYVDENSEKDVEKIDIDEEFQDELCKLWDISMDQEVVLYLLECNSIDLLKGVITKSNAPRITEICIGILANMVCLPSICEKICNDPEFLIILIELFDDHDTPTLIELFRLLNVCLDSNNLKPVLEIIKQKSYVYMKVLFILQSSTNDTLLECCSEFVCKLMDNDDDISKQWGKDELVLAIMEAIKQTGAHKGEYFEPFLHALQILSTFESGLQALETYCGEIMLLCMSYIRHISSLEDVVIDSKENILCYVLSIVKALLITWDGCVELLFDDHLFIQNLLKILATLINNLKNDSDNCEENCHNKNDDEVARFKNQMLSLICELLKKIFCDIIRIIYKVNETNRTNKDEIDKLSCPDTLKYMNSCLDHELKNLFDILYNSKCNFMNQINSEVKSNLEQNSSVIISNIKHSIKSIENKFDLDNSTLSNLNTKAENQINVNHDLSHLIDSDKDNVLHKSDELIKEGGCNENNIKSSNGPYNDHDVDINSKQMLVLENGDRDNYLNLLFKMSSQYNLEKLSRLILKYTPKITL